MRLFMSFVLIVWWYGWRCYAQSSIRISAYPYPDPPGYGMRIKPKDSDQLETDADKAVEIVNATVPLPSVNGNFPSSLEEFAQGEEQQSFRSMSSVNRMGVAKPMITRRTIPSRPQGPSRRSSSQVSGEASTTLRSVVNFPGLSPPSPPSSLGGDPAKPPAPPIFPPSLPKPTLVGQSFGPPSTPETIQAPSPPPGADLAQVTEIKCMDTSSTASFMAVLSLPVGYNAIPVFEDRPSVDPTINTVCRMIPTDIDNNMFQLIVADLDRCGVRKCRQANGETWLCLTLRFPLVSGLKLPEDELILIRCRPQDKMAQNTHAITVSTAKYAAKGAPINQPSPPSVFDGGQQDFRCEIGLFRKLPGTEIFAARVTNEVELDLGEEVQLRSIVRDGDGWQYSRLTTVIIQKVNAPKQRSILSATDLVFADGCRNPSYRVIARNHPKRDPRNPLINNFTFRVFMFQDMDIDEDLMITANIIGCVDAQDCAPTQCDGADEQDRLGYGKKKKRSVGKVGQFTFTTIIPASSRSASSSIPPYPPGTDIPSSIPPFPPPVSPPYSSIAPSVPLSKSNTHDNATTHWARNLRLKVKVPNSDITQKPIEAHECRLYLFITLGVAAVFCIASIIFVVVTLFRARSKPKKVPSPITVTHVQRHPNGSPSFMKPPSSSSASTCSSSLLSSEDSLLRCSNNNSPLRDFSVPPTVRQRKKEVNAELMNVFESERLFPYGTYCPGMLNYYGYMVVPRKAPYESSNEKRSLRAIKRDHKKHRIERVVETCQPVNESKNLESPQRFCQCRDSSDDFANFQDQNHKSVIHIPSSPSNLSSTVMSQCPKPLPRMRKDTEDENIYSEISLESNPTMV